MPNIARLEQDGRDFFKKKTLFWTSGDLYSRFQSQNGQPYLKLAEVYILDLHVPWDPPLVWHLLTSWQWAWQLSCSLPHTSKQALVGLKTDIYHATAHSVRPGRQMIYWLAYAGLAGREYLCQAKWGCKYFFRKLEVRALKIIAKLLNCTLGSPNQGYRGPNDPAPPLYLLVLTVHASDTLQELH